MNKILMGLLALGLIALVGVGGYFLFIKDDESADDNDSEQTTDSEETTEEEAEEPTGPIPFSQVGINIMDADEYSYFTFVNGGGTCMDQNFPLDMIYTSENVMKTQDGSYAEDMTAVDFMGNIRFDGLPLSTGSASCTMETSTNSDEATVTCKVDEAEVCTAMFDVFAYK